MMFFFFSTRVCEKKNIVKDAPKHHLRAGARAHTVFGKSGTHTNTQCLVKVGKLVFNTHTVFGKSGKIGF